MCLSPTHPVVNNSNMEVVCVDFQLGRDSNILSGKSVKRKKVSVCQHYIMLFYAYLQAVTPDSILCYVHCKSGVTYTLRRYIYMCSNTQVLQ